MLAPSFQSKLLAKPVLYSEEKASDDFTRMLLKAFVFLILVCSSLVYLPSCLGQETAR